MEPNYKLIGQRIKVQREKRNMTQERLSEQSGFSPTHISNLENGWTKPSVSSLVRIANALSVSADTLLCDSLIRSEPVFDAQLMGELSDCTPWESGVILDTVRNLKRSLRQHRPSDPQ